MKTVIPPEWLTPEEIRSIKKSLSRGKLTACKELYHLAKEKSTTHYGLNKCKELIDSWESIPDDPLEELSNLIVKIKSLHQQLPLAISNAFPWLNEEDMEKASKDFSYLNNLLNISMNSKKFGI